MIIETKYDLLEVVHIKALDLDGIVDAISYNTYGLTYEVIYWYNSVRQSEWVYEFELEKVQHLNK